MEKTSQLIRDIDDEVEGPMEVELELVRILNQSQLKPITPLGKCYINVGRGQKVSVICRNKLIDCLGFNLTQDLHQVYFRKEKDLLFGDFVVILNDKRQFTRKDLNLLNPNITPIANLPKFDKIWFRATKSVNYTKFYELAVQLDFKIFHETLKGLNTLFMVAATPTGAFYGDSPSATFLKARRERVDSEPIIDTRPRTRSAGKPPPDVLNTIYNPEVINFEDDKHENIDELDQIKFTPSLNFRFKDKRMFTITNSDFKCLYNNYWINDTLIDFFLKLNLEHSIRQLQMIESQVMLLNSFFFTKLMTTGNYYENVKSWFKDDKLFRHRYVIIPVNQDLHWYCLILHNLDRVYDDLKDKEVSIDDEENKIEIFILDSLNQDHKSIREPLVQFLTDFAKDKYDIEIPLEKFKIYLSPIPKQENFNDCGIHVIYNIDIFLNKTEEFQEMWKKPRRKYKSSKKLFLLTDRQNLRIKLRETLIELLQAQEKVNGNSDFEKVGTLTNKDFGEGDTSKIEEEDEEDDSDFEIIESKMHNDNDNKKLEEEEEGGKSKYFPSELSTDSALILENDKPIESKEISHKNEKDISLLSNKLMDSTIDSLNVDDFYKSLVDDNKEIDIDQKQLTKYLTTDISKRMAPRLFAYLLRFEGKLLNNENFEKHLILMIKYFNTLKNDEAPDRELIEKFFEKFLEICELDKDKKEEVEETQENGSQNSEIKISQDSFKAPSRKFKDKYQDGVPLPEKIERRSSQDSIEEIEYKVKKKTQTIDISDNEDYEVLNASIKSNRKKFMSKFPSSDDNGVEIVDEKRLKRNAGKKTMLGSNNETNHSILSMLPVVNRKTITHSSSSPPPPPSPPVTENRGKGRKKQKIG